MKPMGAWNEGDWIAAIAVIVLVVFLAIGGRIAAAMAEQWGNLND